MKFYTYSADECSEERSYYIVGSAREIASLYKNFLKREIADPEFCDYPKFNMDRDYALEINFKDIYHTPSMRVITSSTFESILLDYQLIEGVA